MYPAEPEVHKYLLDRLTRVTDLDQLYELHYQMITLGKVCAIAVPGPVPPTATAAAPGSLACSLRGDACQYIIFMCRSHVVCMLLHRERHPSCTKQQRTACDWARGLAGATEVGAH